MNEPLFVRATALMVLFPNFAVSTFLQVTGVHLCVLKFLFVVRAQRATCAVVQVWMMAPLSIQFENVFRTVGDGRGHLAGPCVWLYSVLYEVIFPWMQLLTDLYATGVGVAVLLAPLLAYRFEANG